MGTWDITVAAITTAGAEAEAIITDGIVADITDGTEKHIRK
jgi:hypothetical protein